MAEHTWTEGEGLKNGLPDIDWAMRKFITVYPTLPYIEQEDYEVNWKVTICWGDTWGHIAYGNDKCIPVAMEKACNQAIKNGCPSWWLPYGEE